MPTRQMHEEDNYLASVSDLMVGLLFVFIIMLMAFALNLRTAEEQADAHPRGARDRACCGGGGAGRAGGRAGRDPAAA